MSTKFVIDGDAVRKLAEILQETDLSEIEYEDQGSRIYVSRKREVMPHSSLASPPSPPLLGPILTQPSAPHSDPSHPGTVKSPLVGVAYLSPEPGAPPFVSVGDQVAAGQPLLIVEAMKVMNPIKAPHAGKILRLLVQNAAPVEYDEPLLIIE